MSYSLFAVVLISVATFYAAGQFPSKDGDCFLVCEPEEPATATGIETLCIYVSRTCRYCNFVVNPCPRVEECSGGLIQSADGRCLICPGMVCAYEMKAYGANDEFNSMDGQNKIRCEADGNLTRLNHVAIMRKDLCNLDQMSWRR